ncbi:MAG TPA: hypothetical protein VM513_01770 [Kofleriaceae bacterium]|nr:hypothetical protein [Kofleriaceae bacterium]
MSRGRKIAAFVGGAFVSWIVVLVIVGATCGGATGKRVATRVAESLNAEVTIDHTDLALVRGRIELEGMKVRKDDLGHLAIDVADVRCELPPLGLALVDRECRELVIDKVRLEVTSAAVFQLKRPKKQPLRARHVELHDAVLTFSPSAFLPELGKIEIKIDDVVAGPTTFKTPLSWMFSMQELRATLDLPAGIVVKLEYAAGVLTAAGGIFGAKPVRLPITIPVADAADDAKAEVAKLVALGRQIAERLVEQRAKDWIRSKVKW